MGGYDKTDAAKDTGSSTSEVSHAWHAARDDAQSSGELPERAAHKAEKPEKSSEKDSGTRKK
jgi:hypothetical protein